MINSGFGSRAASPLKRHARQLIGVNTIFATSVIAVTVVSALVITPPALARNGSGTGGPTGASSSHVSSVPSHGATPGSNATGSAGHRVPGTGSSQQFNNASRGEGWHHGSTPPGWTGHGEKRGWEGGKMPPGLSRHDHDHDHDRWENHRTSDWGDERRNHEQGQLHTGQLERRWGW